MIQTIDIESQNDISPISARDGVFKYVQVSKFIEDPDEDIFSEDILNTFITTLNGASFRDEPIIQNQCNQLFKY